MATEPSPDKNRSLIEAAEGVLSAQIKSVTDRDGSWVGVKESAFDLLRIALQRVYSATDVSTPSHVEPIDGHWHVWKLSKIAGEECFCGATRPGCMGPVTLPSTTPQNDEAMRTALQKIARWHGEFPPAGKWDDGTPMSYGAAYGSNGERDYMRQIALNALSSAASATARTTVPTVVTAALVMAKATLERWAELYGKLSEAYPKVRQMDYNLPPSDHVRTLEAIDVAIPESKVSVASANTGTMMPIEREHMIQWHEQCAALAAQTDDFKGERFHQLRAEALRRSDGGNDRG